jgi:hypothetical protein
MKPLRQYGTTKNGWKISEPVTMTTRAKAAWVIARDKQSSLVENRNGDWYYMESYDTSVLPPKGGRDGYLLSIRGKNVKKARGLQDALELLGVEHDDAREILGMIFSPASKPAT